MNRFVRNFLLAATLAVACAAAAQTTPAPKPNPQAESEANFPATQEQLLKLLRLSPTLTEVVARDPSLLSNQEYVARNNPELGQFLLNHPEVARNPSFYLFTHLPPGHGSNEEALEQKVWPDTSRQERERPLIEYLINDVGPFVILVTLLSVLIWVIRTLLENRRWSRIFKLQTDVHGKLIDRFASSQELLGYMGTEAGNRFLQAAPIPVDFEAQQRMPNAVARVLMPLQIGIVLTLTGLGFMLLSGRIYDHKTELLIFGVLTLMPGLGFIISAGMTWVLAQRLGLMPEPGQAAQAEKHTRVGQ